MAHAHLAKWHHMFLYPDWFRRLHQRPGRFLPGMVTSGMTVADIGCGLGFYSIEMAKLVGPTGRVLAIDLQSQMLRIAEKKAKKAGLLERISFIRCAENDLKITDRLDFALSMWMAHEVPDPQRLFRQVRDALKPGAQYLLAEPRFHVKAQAWREICGHAEAAGLSVICEPEIAASFTALLQDTA